MPQIRNNRDATDAVSQLDIELRTINRDRQTLADLRQAAENLLNSSGASYIQVKRQIEALKTQKQAIARGVAQAVQVNNELFAPASVAAPAEGQRQPAQRLINNIDPEVNALMNMDIN